MSRISVRPAVTVAAVVERDGRYLIAESGETFVRFTFAATARGHEPARPLDAGIVRALWLPYDDIAASARRHRSPLVLRSVDDYRAGRRWPLGLIASL